MTLKVGKSKEAFSDNVSAEMNAGKPQKQAVAIAYAQKRKAEKRAHMWRGGNVPVTEESEADVEHIAEAHGEETSPHVHDENCEFGCDLDDEFENDRDDTYAYDEGGQVEDSSNIPAKNPSIGKALIRRRGR